MGTSLATFKDFSAGELTAQAIETARGEWKDHLPKILGGFGHIANNILSSVEGLDSLAEGVTGLADTIGIGIPPQIAEGIVHGTLALGRGWLKTQAENASLKKIGAGEEHMGKFSRTVQNAFGSVIPFLNLNK